MRGGVHPSCYRPESVERKLDGTFVGCFLSIGFKNVGGQKQILGASYIHTYKGLDATSALCKHLFSEDPRVGLTVGVVLGS